MSATNYIALASTIIFVVGLYFTFRCKHAWALVSDREFPPKIEDYKKNGGTYLYGPFWIEGMTRRTYIAIVKCDKCGALRKFKEHS